MFKTWIEDSQAWWATVSTEFAFLMLLPLAVAGAALVADFWRDAADRRLSGHTRRRDGRPPGSDG